MAVWKIRQPWQESERTGNWMWRGESAAVPRNKLVEVVLCRLTGAFKMGDPFSSCRSISIRSMPAWTMASMRNGWRATWQPVPLPVFFIGKTKQDGTMMATAMKGAQPAAAFTQVIDRLLEEKTP